MQEAPQPLKSIPKFLSLAVAVLGNLSLSFLFLRALLNPTAHADFISRISIVLYVFEFLSLHASGMFTGMRQSPQADQQKFKVTGRALVGFYLLFALAYGWHFHNWVLATMFMVSTLAKFSGRQAVPGTEQEKFALTIMSFLLLTFITIPLQGLLGHLFPFPSSMASSGGLFERFPQTLLFWGCCYYTTCAAIEALGFKGKIRPRHYLLTLAAVVLLTLAIGWGYRL